MQKFEILLHGKLFNMNHTKAQLSFRNVLLSSWELTTEAVIKYDWLTFYESAPEWRTLWLKESQGLWNEYKWKFEFSFDDFDQRKFDKELLENSSSQISTAASLAYMKAYAYALWYDWNNLYKFFSKEYWNIGNIPKIISNILNWGKHATNKLSFCEFMIIPQWSTTEENVRIASEIYLDLWQIIEEELWADNLYIWREGWFAPHLDSNEQAISLIERAINKRNSWKCNIAIDVAANNFSENIKDNFEYIVDGTQISTNEFIRYYENLLKKHPSIVYLEDPFHEEDIEWRKELNSRLWNSIMIVADDLTITKSKNIEKYINLFNACILKLNQAWTLSEFIDSFNMCNKYWIKTIVSQRSWETDSNLISHIAMWLWSNYLKAWAPARERIVKYNELIRIS